MWCFAKKSLHESCWMGRCIDAGMLICSLGHCECNSHTVHKPSQRRLTADWLAPQESDCSRMRSKVSSDWLRSYIKATRPFLNIFKTAGYFLDRSHTYIFGWCVDYKLMFFWGMTACSLQMGNIVFKEPATFICILISVSYSALETAGFFPKWYYL